MPIFPMSCRSPPPVYNLELAVGQPHQPRDHQTRVGDAFRVTSRPRRLGVDCAGQSRERFHIECVQLVNESCIGQCYGYLIRHLARPQEIFLAERRWCDVAECDDGRKFLLEKDRKYQKGTDATCGERRYDEITA